MSEQQPPAAGTQPPLSEEDRAWLAALSGEPVAEPASEAARDGRLLRAALALRVARDEARLRDELDRSTSDEALDAGFEALRKRAIATGRLPPALAAAAGPAALGNEQPAAGTTAIRPLQPPGAGQSLVVPPWRRPVLWGGLAAGVLAAVLLGPSGLLREPDRIYGPPMQTSGTEGRQAVRVDQPRQAAEALAAQLTAEGLKNGLFQDGKRFGVDVNLTAADLATAAPAFAVAAPGLQPAIGFNRVQFDPR